MHHSYIYENIFIYTGTCLCTHTYSLWYVHQTGIVVNLLGFFKYLFYLSTHLFIWLGWVLVVAQDLHCVMCNRSFIVARTLSSYGACASCSAACGILVPQPGIKLSSLELHDGFLNHWTTKEVPNLLLYRIFIPMIMYL